MLVRTSKGFNPWMQAVKDVIYIIKAKRIKTSCFNALFALRLCPFITLFFQPNVKSYLCKSPSTFHESSHAARVCSKANNCQSLEGHGSRRFPLTSLLWQLMLYFALCGPPSIWNEHQSPLNTCDLCKALHNQYALLTKVDQATPMGGEVLLLGPSGVVGTADTSSRSMFGHHT